MNPIYKNIIRCLLRLDFKEAYGLLCFLRKPDSYEETDDMFDIYYPDDE